MLSRGLYIQIYAIFGLKLANPGCLKFFAAPFNSYFYIEQWTFKGICEVYYRAKRDKKEAT